MSLDYEKKKYRVIKEMVDGYKEELLKGRELALEMPIETDNGFNVERERLLNDIDEKLEIMRRHIKEPYFAKLIFKDIDDEEEFQGYIGRLSIGELSDPSDNKVIDWRAPISDLYYNGRIGKTSYRANGDEYNVDLKLKRQIDIKNDEVKSIFDFEDTISTDEFLKPYLTQSADNRLKNIVATIQEEQDRIIRLPIFTNVVVQGVAGSGKTTVALHRISYLMYNYKNQVKPEEYLIISPNEIFMSYISSILTDLDAEKTNSFSLNKMAESVIGSEYTIMSKHAQYKHLMSKKASTDYLKYKGSKEFAKCIDAYIADYKERVLNKDIVINGVKILDGALVPRYFNTDRDLCLETQFEHGCKKLALAIAYDANIKGIVDGYLNSANIPLTKKFAIRRKCESANSGYLSSAINTNLNLMNMYNEFITNIEKYCDYEDYKTLKKYTLDNLKQKRVSHDDLACILYMLYRTQPAPYYNSMRCVLIDEAQDLSELMYIALKGVFNNATFGIFGDIAQGIYAYQSIDNWTQVTDILEDAEMLYLKRSYRTSIEIMEEANKTLEKLGTPPAQNVIRHGDPVDYIPDNSVDTISNILDKCKEFAHTAIICKDDNELIEAQQTLSDLNIAVIDENNISYDNNKHILLTVQTAKGLEFDSVILYNKSAYTDSVVDLRLLYVAQTRALHKLTICDKSTE